LHSRWSDLAARASEAIHRRDNRPASGSLELSRGGWVVPPLRRRRQVVRLPEGRVDGRTDELEGQPESPGAAPGKRFADAGAVRVDDLGEARRSDSFSGVHGSLGGNSILRIHLATF